MGDPDVDLSPVSTMIIPLVGSTGLGVTGCAVVGGGNVVVVVVVEGFCDVDEVVVVVVVDEDDVGFVEVSTTGTVDGGGGGGGTGVSETNLTTNFSTSASLPVSSISMGTLGTTP